MHIEYMGLFVTMSTFTNTDWPLYIPVLEEKLHVVLECIEGPGLRLGLKLESFYCNIHWSAQITV